MLARVLTLVVITVSGMGFFQNCAVEHPGNTASLQTQTVHAAVKAECTACHADKFNVATHRPTDGRDCNWCHVPNAWLPGDFQLDGIGHKPLAKSCLACHSFQSPTYAKLPDEQGERPTHYGGQDCVLCHEPNHDKFMFLHSEAHGETVGFCLECHTSRAQVAHPGNPEFFTGKGSCQSCHQDSTKWN